mmetsp:Transcript_3366/g.7939  ORF Transcript_3366/g.7939 Transcript_3366/m.7939 type:complete len:163 (+) Transcript_3366:368-856(+)
MVLLCVPLKQEAMAHRIPQLTCRDMNVDMKMGIKLDIKTDTKTDMNMAMDMGTLTSTMQTAKCALDMIGLASPVLSTAARKRISTRSVWQTLSESFLWSLQKWAFFQRQKLSRPMTSCWQECSARKVLLESPAPAQRFIGRMRAEESKSCRPGRLRLASRRK